MIMIGGGQLCLQKGTTANSAFSYSIDWKHCEEENPDFIHPDDENDEDDNVKCLKYWFFYFLQEEQAWINVAEMIFNKTASSWLVTWSICDIWWWLSWWRWCLGSWNSSNTTRNEGRMFCFHGCTKVLVTRLTVLTSTGNLHQHIHHCSAFFDHAPFLSTQERGVVKRVIHAADPEGRDDVAASAWFRRRPNAVGGEFFLPFFLLLLLSLSVGAGVCWRLPVPTDALRLLWAGLHRLRPRRQES